MVWGWLIGCRLETNREKNHTSFVYDGDGKQVTSTVNGVVSKYYFAGAQRVAMRAGSTLTYLLGDHLGSTSLSVNTNGALVSELRYKPWGETRYTSGTMPMNYQFTSQPISDSVFLNAFPQG